MGDRGNICVHYGDKGTRRVYLYTHWQGSSLPQLVANVLALPYARRRWKDESYLARILFCALVGHSADPETEFGIAPYESDPENPTVHVWPERGVAWVGKGLKWSFMTFIDKYK